MTRVLKCAFAYDRILSVVDIVLKSNCCLAGEGVLKRLMRHSELGRS